MLSTSNVTIGQYSISRIDVYENIIEFYGKREPYQLPRINASIISHPLGKERGAAVAAFSL